ncbi:MAG: hypothetical protein IJP75_01175, partial [Bacteroidaceae bacterium]|nr:hypothetical protein [Bacteroidaceae bacterium]
KGVIGVKAYTLSTVERSSHASITFGFNSSNSFNFFNSKKVELAKLKLINNNYNYDYYILISSSLNMLMSTFLLSYFPTTNISLRDDWMDWFV